MLLKVVFLSAVVLVVSVEGFGSIAENQGFGIGVSTLGTVFGGAGSLDDAKTTMVNLGQTITPTQCQWALEDDNIVLSQKAKGVGLCGVLGVQQDGTALGEQHQSVQPDWNGLSAQGQGLDVNVGETASHSDAAGVVSASSTFLADRLQALSSPATSMNAGQFINLSQQGCLAGGIALNGGFDHSAQVVTTQSQGNF
jgi:hypothetical protein